MVTRKCKPSGRTWSYIKYSRIHHNGSEFVGFLVRTRPHGQSTACHIICNGCLYNFHPPLASSEPKRRLALPYNNSYDMMHPRPLDVKDPTFVFYAGGASPKQQAKTVL
eukprot:8969233-Pyramimonas_sp.AAC.1